MRVRLLGAFVLLLAAWSTAAAAHHTGGKLEVHDAWVRETLPGKEVTAAFLTFTNDGDADALVAVACDVAASAEMHKMTDAGGMMKMEQVPRIDIPSHREVKLAPGGLHLMLFGIKEPLAAGKTVKLTLTFEKAKIMVLEVPVRALAGKK